MHDLDTISRRNEAAALIPRPGDHVEVYGPFHGGVSTHRAIVNKTRTQKLVTVTLCPSNHYAYPLTEMEFFETRALAMEHVMKYGGEFNLNVAYWPDSHFGDWK